MTLPEENPNLIEVLHGGGFSINRFQLFAVEQTIYAESVKRYNDLCGCYIYRQEVGCYKLYGNYGKSFDNISSRIGSLKAYK